MGPASERRRFLDRLVLAVDAEHTGRVSALERSLRSATGCWRSRGRPALARRHRARDRRTCGRGRGRPRRDGAAPAGRARAAQGRRVSVGRDRARRLDGKAPAEPSRGRDRGALPRSPQDDRARDAAAGRTLDGPHLTDLRPLRAEKHPAADASTGEQKALLIGLVLAHAGLLAEMTGVAPFLLLDEIAAHLDPGRRAALFDALAASAPRSS